MSVGENIKIIRKEKGLTQKQLADKLGTTQQNLAQYENNKRKPKLETLQKIADALCTPLETLDENFRNIGNLLESVKLKNSLENIEKEYRDKDIEGIQEIQDILRMTIQDLDIDIAEYQNTLKIETEWFTTIKDIYTQLNYESKKTLKNIVTDYAMLNEDGRIALIEQMELIKKIPDYKNTSPK